MTSETVGLLVEFKAKYDETRKAFAEVLKGGDQVTENNKKMESSFASLSTKGTAGIKSIVGGVTVLATALLSATGLIYAFAGKVGDSVDELTDKARGLGVAATDLQRIGYAASLSGVGLDSIGASLKKFNINVGLALSGNQAAIDSFKAIGVSVDQLKGKDLTQQFILASTAAGSLTDKNQAAAASAKVFGKSYTDALSVGRDGIAENVKEFDSLGIALSDSQRKAVDSFGDSKTKLAAIFEGFSAQVVAAVSPAFAALTNQVSDFILKSGGIQGVAEKVGNSVISIVQGTITTFQTIAATVGFLIDKLEQLRTSSLGQGFSKATEAAGSFIADANGPREDTFASNLSGFLGSLSPFKRVDSATDPFPYDKNSNTFQGAFTGYNPNTKNESIIPNFLTGSSFQTLTTSTTATTKALDKMTTAANASSDAITQGFGSLDSKANNDELNKAFDIIGQRTADNRPQAQDSDFEQWAADLIQQIKDGGLSSQAYNASLSNLSQLKNANDLNGFNTSGQQGVIDEIQKYASSLGTKTQQVEVGITVTPSEDFIVKVAKNSYSTITDVITNYAANAARLGAKS